MDVAVSGVLWLGTSAVWTLEVESFGDQRYSTSIKHRLTMWILESWKHLITWMTIFEASCDFKVRSSSQPLLNSQGGGTHIDSTSEAKHFVLLEEKGSPNQKSPLKH